MDDGIYPAAYGHIEVEVPLAAPRPLVWRALVNEVHAWWLPAYHLLAADSQMAFDCEPGGGGLYERSVDGSGLQWYSLHCILPSQFKLYLVGHLAEDWGGPACSYLQIALTATPSDSCLMHVRDAHVGRVSQASLDSVRRGWEELFGKGLKPYVETLAAESGFPTAGS